MAPFKRRVREKSRRNLTITSVILVSGFSIMLLLGYVSIENIYKGGELSGLQGSSDFAPFADYRRVLQDNNVNTVSECKNGTNQAEFCIGSGEVCKSLPEDSMIGGLVVVILFLIYLFIGIAIVCDELFVPALEIIAEKYELSNDVAGATLMAAGGSAPELATSMVGAFKRSDVGFGTIVGSAVFNVLFVIGVCVMATPQKYSPLELTWWPLFRDCMYYVLTLATLALFASDGKIFWWEALIQFALYFGYVYMMSYSQVLETIVNNKLASWMKYLKNGTAGDVVVPTVSDVMDDAIELGKNVPSTAPVTSMEKNIMGGGDANFNRPSTFRVGILQLLTSKGNLSDTAGIAFVSKIKGDVNVVFDRIDANKNGEIDKNELKMCLKELGTPEEDLSDEAVNKVMSEINSDHGKEVASKADFTIWYTRNETRLKNELREAFDRFDVEKKGTITKSDINRFMAELGHTDEEIVKEQIAETIAGITTDFITYDQFTTWYENSLFWQQEKNAAEQAADSQETLIDGIYTTWSEWNELSYRARSSFIVMLPLTVITGLFVPDCRPNGKEHKAPFTLFCSVVLIALYAIVMVELAEIFGKTLGVPDVIMGITILAAGTSVPDLLSSVIVARQGEGDMAVSSSIGSNIFDVAFGLPLPWLIYAAFTAGFDCTCMYSEMEADGLLPSLLTLLAMVFVVVFIIMAFEWKMTYGLGVAMLISYILYLLLAIFVFTSPKDFEAPECPEGAKFYLF